MSGLFTSRQKATTPSSSPASHEAEHNTNDEAPLTWKSLCMVAFGVWGGILFGYDAGYINGVLGMNQFKIDFGTPGSTRPDAYMGYMYETSQKSLVASILSAGTFFGALCAGFFADCIGRKYSVILGCAVYIVGVILQVTATTFKVLIPGRAIAGLGVGIESAACLLYMQETAPRMIRGSITSGYQFLITVGILLSAGVNEVTKDREDSGAYRIPIAVQFVWALILIVGFLILPDSPRYFIMKGQAEKAKASLAKLRDQAVDSDLVTQEVQHLTEAYEEEVKVSSTSWKDCFTGGLKRGSNLRRTLVGTTVQMMQQLTGVNFIFFFGTTFFQSAGIKNPFLITLVTTIVNVVATPSSFYTIERYGRRKLLIIGSAGMSIAVFLIAIIGTANQSSRMAGHVVLIVFTCIFISFFAGTWGPVGWAVSGEVFPLTIRAKGIALSTASNWLWNFAIAYTLPYLVDTNKANLGPKVFFIWGTTCFVGLLFAYFFVHETKGRSLEEIDLMMKECPARRSASWTPENQRGRAAERDAEAGEVNKEGNTVTALTLRASSQSSEERS